MRDDAEEKAASGIPIFIWYVSSKEGEPKRVRNVYRR